MKTVAIILTLSLFAAGTLFAQVDLESDLVLYFTFDEITDAWVTDAASGIAADVEGPSYSVTEGWIGNGLDLNPNEGDITFVDVAAVPVLNITEQITLSVWVYARDCGNGEDNPWITKGDHGYAIKHRGLHSDTNMNEFEFFIYGAGGWHSVKAPADEAYNEFWHHFAGTFDGLTLILYIDGEPVTTSEEYVGFIDSTIYPINIGRNSEKQDRLYNGIIDEARIYSRALTPEEIMALYTLPTRLHQANNFPEEFVLNQNFPNPFNPTTHISYSLPKTGYVTLKVFDLQGRETATLVDQFQNGGEYTVGFDASSLPSGVYFYRLQLGNSHVLTRKMLVVR